MTIAVGSQPVNLNLAAWEQSIHTPSLALATMLHRDTVLAHGTADQWADSAESVLLAQVMVDAGNDPVLQLINDAGHDLEEADDAAIGAFADALAARMQPRDLPPVLMAIEEMS